MLSELALQVLLAVMDEEFGYYDELTEEDYTPSQTMVKLAKELREEKEEGWNQ